jgi:peptidyl-prolyl cis-trans isomerase B (cyclophilin B)
MLKRIGLIILTFAMVMMISGCGGTAPTGASNAKASPSPTGNAKVNPSPSPTGVAVNTNADLTELKKNKIAIEIVMQDGGVVKANLYPDIALITVANFMELVNDKFYDGLIFHRVIPEFMIQGGGFDQNNTQKQAASIKGEFAANGVENNLLHTRGVLSMARTDVKDSASSQFFIMVADSPHLDGGYAAFGEVTSGMDVVDKIVGVETGVNDKPVKNQVIKSIRKK